MRGMVINMEETKLRPWSRSRRFWRGIGGSIPGAQRGSQPVYRAGVQAAWLRSTQSGRQGRSAALYRTHERAIAPASDPAGGAIPQEREADEAALQTQAGVYIPLYGGGRKKYRYEDTITPYEKFKSIPEAGQYLKDGITLEQLDAQAAK